ncbi:MAG: UDP-3-O-acyl-N-acetylglucosamine deacetylase [Patescibacteria group bacterium]
MGLKLVAPFVFGGYDITGFKNASVRFSPSPDFALEDFSWRILVDGHRFDLRPEILESARRSLCVLVGGRRICLLEHILAYRAVLGGLDLKIGSEPVPYEGGAEALHRQLQGRSRLLTTEAPWRTLKFPRSFQVEDGLSRSLHMAPCKERELRIRVKVEYDFGKAEHEYVICSFKDMEKFAKSRPLGFPRIARLPLKLFWPHASKNIWLTGRESRADIDSILEELCRHKVLDFLGATAFLCGQGFFGAQVVIDKSNHKLDVKAVHQVWSENNFSSI